MAETPTQDGRVGKLATPLGKDKLCLTRFEGTEAVGDHAAGEAERPFFIAAVRLRARGHRRGTMLLHLAVGLR
jgi:hypothetical protein